MKFFQSKLILWEALAVLLGLSYSLSLVNKLWISWVFAIVSSIIFMVLCINKRIFAEAGLHVFYLFTAIYGWLNFETNQTATIQISGLQHIGFIIILAGISWLLAKALKTYSTQVTPNLDSFTTVFSMGATLLMINLVPENWLYFIIINGFAVWLYASRKLYITSGLMVFYMGVAIYGYLEWT